MIVQGREGIPSGYFITLKDFSLFFNLKICYYILHKIRGKKMIGGVEVGKIYYGSGSGDYRFSSDNLQS